MFEVKTISGGVEETVLTTYNGQKAKDRFEREGAGLKGKSSGEVRLIKDGAIIDRADPRTVSKAS